MEHLLRLMESLLDPFSESSDVATCHTGVFFPSSFPCCLASRAVIHSLRLEPLFSPHFKHSQPPSLHGLGIQSHILSVQSHIPSIRIYQFQFGIQSHHLLQFDIQSHHIFSLTFKAISLVRHSKPLVSLAFKVTIFLQLGVQSHIPSIQSCHFLLVWDLEPHCQHLELFFFFQFNIQSCLAYFRHSESPCLVQVLRTVLLNLVIQSHLPQFRISKPFFSYQAFRATSSVQAFKATSLNEAFRVVLPSLGIWSHNFRRLEPPCSIRHSKPLGVQSHLTQFRCSKPFFKFRHSEPSVLVQAFRTTVLGVQSHFFQFRHSEPFIPI